MKSPFPGMDPYIEACNLWEDFHQKLIGEIEVALSRILPEQYSARIGERAYITLNSGETSHAERFSMQGDVTIVSPSAPSGEFRQSQSTALASVVSEDSEPIEMLALESTSFREPFIEIRSLAPERPLVTTIEVLSPSNKRRGTEGTEGWELYQRKRNAHLSGAANLVELDLLRGGQRLPMATPWPDSPYTILVSRKASIPRCSAWRASFATPLPMIPIPLAHPDPDVHLSLQPMVDAIYVRSRYANDIDYSNPCVPALTSSEEEWFRGVLARRVAL